VLKIKFNKRIFSKRFTFNYINIPKSYEKATHLFSSFCLGSQNRIKGFTLLVQVGIMRVAAIFELE
jgi:hypothetical protein